VGVLSSVVAAYFYVYVIVVMFFRDPEPGAAAYVVHPSVLTSATIAVGAAATIVLGVVPGPVLNLAGLAGQFLR
jgi:NADH-quinone oxidoreductase subunit N